MKKDRETKEKKRKIRTQSSSIRHYRDLRSCDPSNRHCREHFQSIRRNQDPKAEKLARTKKTNNRS